MGKKSDKKIKSDRVNALRKRYDAFLEEDKKRKERNEYILGCLDKMRYATATATQLRPKTVFGEYYTPVFNRIEYRPEKLRVHEEVVPVIRPPVVPIQRPNENNLQLTVPIQRNYLEDATILNEISKKYILIPKLRSTYPAEHLITIPPEEKTLSSNPVTPPAEKPIASTDSVSATETNDWKSKYAILEQLKQKEKEEFNEYNNNVGLSTNETHLYDTTEKYKNDRYDNIPSKYEEIPEKDLPVIEKFDDVVPPIESLSLTENINQEPQTWQDQENNPQEVVREVHHVPSEALAPGNEIQQNEVTNQEPQYEQFIPEKHDSEIVETNEQAEYVNNEYQNTHPEYQEYPNNEVYAHNEQENVYTAGTDMYNQQNTPVQAMNASEYQDYQNEPIYAQEQVSGEAEYPAVEKNDQEHKQEDNINSENANQETEGVENVEQQNTVQEVPVDDTINLGIQEFEAEQTEMFHSEDTNYEYEQQGLAEAYNNEYVQNQEYPQAEYSYSQNVEQQQVYPSEVNEYEETSQPYDQSYVEQYVTNPEEYNQPQQYEPTQYDQTAEYAPYEEYNYEQQNIETVQQVENVLDNEDGYQNQEVTEIQTGEAENKVA